MTTERATINQQVQWGDETTPGTGVSADKLLECFNVHFAPKPDVQTFRGTGRRWPSIAEENREWTELKIDGVWDYFGFTYLVAGAWGIVSPATHTAGTLSKDWVWTPAVSGPITPRTYTVEMGDSVRAHKIVYGLITGFGYKGTRKGLTCDAAMMGQALSDGITMTSSPTAVALAPVVGKQVNVYIDSTSGGLGGTQLTRAFSLDYSYDSGFGTFWPLNRSNVSYTGHVDLPPKNTFKILVESNAAGMAYLGNLQNGDTLYVRVDALGTIIEGSIHYEIIHDMAIKLTDVSDFKDEEGVFAIEYTGEICEDSSWGSGKSQVMTLTNTLTAL
jgi:hypothetical protein